jgi:hypothetical protein
LREVIVELRSGKLPAPGFTAERIEDAWRSKCFPVFLEGLRTEREKALKAGFSGDYASTLILIYDYFDVPNSYLCVLLSDCTKRLLLEWGQERIVGTNRPADLVGVSNLLKSTSLKREKLRLFVGPHAESDQDQLHAGALDETGQLFWRVLSTHCPKGVPTEHAYQLAMAGPLSTSHLASGYHPLPCMYRVLQTELIRVVHLEGTISFLDNNGEVAKVDPADIRYYRTIMPREHANRFRFPALGVLAFRPEFLLDFVKDPRSTGLRGQGSWVTPVFQ